MNRTGNSDHGSVTGFVVVITVMLLGCAGLVIDGARIIGAKIAAADHAENAARAGAQEIVTVRDGVWVLDTANATTTASAYLAAHGVIGSVQASPLAITVTVTATVSTPLLALVGITSKTVTASRSSVPISESS